MSRQASNSETEMSAPMRQVVDSLVAGVPPPSDVQAALSPAEVADVAALARSAHLTRLVMQKPDPAADAEAQSLETAQAALRARPPQPPTPTEAPTLGQRLRNFLRPRRGDS